MSLFILLALVLLFALAFEYINGFHDAANAIATVVSTKVLTPRQAIALAACMDMTGALLGTAVATTIATGFVHIHVGMAAIVCALLAAIVWNLITWFFGIPSSSSHALIGGLCGAALAQAATHSPDLPLSKILIWNETITKVGADGVEVTRHIGLWPKLVEPMLISPVFGFVLGVIVMFLLTVLLVKARPALVQRWFGKLQILSAGGMALGHGMNDAQKTMGIITLALVAGTSGGVFNEFPDWLREFFQVNKGDPIPRWVQIICAVTIAAGTAGGGWRIIRTMGHKMVKLQPVHGFAAETSAAAVIQFASHFGIPLSTTHVISTSIMGVGAMKRFSAVKWGIVGKIVWAWVLTMPVTATLGWGIYRIGWLLRDVCR